MAGCDICNAPKGTKPLQVPFKDRPVTYVCDACEHTLEQFSILFANCNEVLSQVIMHLRIMAKRSRVHTLNEKPIHVKHKELTRALWRENLFKTGD